MFELLREQRVDRVLQGSHLARPRVAALAQVSHDRIDLLVTARRVRNPELGDLREIRLPPYTDLPALEVLDQRIEAPVLADDVEMRVRFFRSEFADVIRNVKVQCVWPAACNFDVVRLLP